MRIIKPLTKVLGVLVVAGLMCSLLSFVLVPYGTKSAVMWHDIRQTEKLDCVYLGTSLVGRSVDPNLIDERLGTESFNMATPSQTLEDSYLGIEDAIKNHGVRRVVLGIEYAGLVSKTESKAGVFVSEKVKGESLPEALHDWTTAIDLETWLGDSVALSIIFFPWQIQHVDSLEEAFNNVKMQFDGTSIYKAAEANEANWTYYGKGFGSTDQTAGYSYGSDRYYLNYYDIAGNEHLNDERMAVLERICDLCNENDVELIMVTTPLADAQIVSFGELYGTFASELGEFAKAHGAKFYDINLARPELFTDNNAYYHDLQHMNYDGSQAFSESLARLLGGIDAGEPVDEWFGTYDERVAMVTSVASAGFDKVTCDSEAVHLTAVSTIGPNASVEYRFSCAPIGADGKPGDYEVVQNWSPSGECTFTPAERGVYRVRVQARTAGNEKAEISDSRLVIF